MTALSTGTGIASARTAITGAAPITPPPPVMMETFFLLTEGGDILTDEAGNRLVWRL